MGASKNTSRYLPVAIPTLLAALLRVPYFDRPLAGDEAFSFNKYGLLSWERILFYYDDTNQHSLFILLSNACMRLFGESEVFFRLPSFWAGVFAVPLLYYLGRVLDISRAVSLTASCLLVFSNAHLTYSQEGRGYALTVFLALALVLSATKLLQRKNAAVWGVLLVVSGLCMLINIPSNAFFLAATGVYCLAVKLSEKKNRLGLVDKNFVLIAIGFLILLFLGGVYLSKIYPELKGFADSWNGTVVARLNLSLFFQITTFMVSPWGLWLYAFFLFGWFNLKSKNNALLFASIFTTPALLMFATGTGGFARTYIYFLPFILFLAALGIIEAIGLIKRLNPALGKCFAAVVAIGMACELAENLIPYYHYRYVEPAEHLTLYYDEIHYSLPRTSMAEAREVASFVESTIPRNRLIALSRPADDALNHYLQKRIQENARLFIEGENPYKIIFITRRDKLPWVHPMSDGNFIVPHDSVKQIADIGNTRIYEFERNIERLAPSGYDPDQEVKLLSDYDNPTLKIEKTGGTGALGAQSLVLTNKEEKVLTVNTTVIKSIDIKKEGAYILLAYLREWGQQSDFLLVDYSERNSPLDRQAQLVPGNRSYRMAADGTGFIIDKANHIWEKVVVLYPISPGHHDLVGVFTLVQSVSYFDGIQSFIVS